ncbi:hypothetical protein CFB82_27725 [Burkholderia sp. HI2714]|nr:hypothetical protein CFB82_27725 [Burkholderia sp. HI2714]
MTAGGADGAGRGWGSYRRPLLPAVRCRTRWSKRIRSTGPTCEKSACLHFPRQIAALKHLHTIDPKRTIRRQA